MTSGEHTHPDTAEALAMLGHEVARLAANLSTLTAQVVALEAGQVATDRRLAALEAAAAQDAYDYAYLGKPGKPQTVGRTYGRLDLSEYDGPPGLEFTLVYLNITPTFRAGKYAGAIRPRLVRANGDATMYDDIQLHADALDSDGVSCRNRLYFETGDDATYMELKCIGGLTSAVLDTRYRKVATIHR